MDTSRYQCTKATRSIEDKKFAKRGNRKNLLFILVNVLNLNLKVLETFEHAKVLRFYAFQRVYLQLSKRKQSSFDLFRQ